MAKITEQDWLDWLHGKRIDAAALSDPRKVALRAMLDAFAGEVDEHDPDRAGRVAARIARILRGRR